jgi:hypothetical protein
MKQMVAARRQGIISTPNQPTYRRLLVEVTHSQNWFHAEAPWRFWRVVVMRTVGGRACLTVARRLGEESSR